MIYFDEMGLAEISPNNPLKVIHSQLEYDENEDKVAFIGISNWTLDASKMNRGIYLAGGGALIKGIDKLIHEETGMPVKIADNALDCVVTGAGSVAENLDVLRDILVSRRMK